MISLKDLNVLLEKIPAWKKLVRLPDKISELEARIEELESKFEKPLSKKACPSCGEKQWFVVHSRKMPKWEKTERRYKCKTCQFEETVME